MMQMYDFLLHPTTPSAFFHPFRVVPIIPFIAAYPKCFTDSALLHLGNFCKAVCKNDKSVVRGAGLFKIINNGLKVGSAASHDVDCFLGFLHRQNRFFHFCIKLQHINRAYAVFEKAKDNGIKNL